MSILLSSVLASTTTVAQPQISHFGDPYLLMSGLLAAPYYGGYYGGPYYGGPYYGYGYGGGCYITRRWVINRYGHRVWRRVRVCY